MSRYNTVEHLEDHIDRRESKKKKKEKLKEFNGTNDDYDLSWFKPTTSQKEIIRSAIENDLTIVQGSTGSGKSSTAIFHALSELKAGNFKQLMFVKTASEAGDDQIGYLSGNESQKLAVHMESMRYIFLDFMSYNKLEMEEKRMNIKFTIPNFIQGRTLYNTILLIDEAQSISPKTMKLLLERLGQGSKCILLGDKYQRYSAKNRDDGLTDLVNMVTRDDPNGRYSTVPNIGYIDIPASENMRSDISKTIAQLYEGKGSS